MAVRGRKVGRGEGKGSERARAMMILRWRRRRRKAIIVEEFITVNGVASKSRSSERNRRQIRGRGGRKEAGYRTFHKQ